MNIAERRHRIYDGVWRMRIVRLVFGLLTIVVIGRLFVLQVLSADFWQAVAEGQYSFYEEIVPERGTIYVRDHANETEYPVATNEPRALVSADPRLVTDPVTLAKKLALILEFEGYEEYERYELLLKLRASNQWTEASALETVLWEARLARQALAAAEAAGEDLPSLALGESADLPLPPPLQEGGATEVAVAGLSDELELGPFVLDLNENQVAALVARLGKTDDPYEPVDRNVNDEQLQLIEALNEPALFWVIEDARSYPERLFGGQVLGFLGRDAGSRHPLGQYGLEGYHETFLAGQTGNLYSQTDLAGRWIGVGDRAFRPAIDGGDLLLSIDRTLQATVCEKLAAGVEKHKADSGSVVIVEPSTGRILAMCGAPDFYPGEYGQVESVAVYNNQAIFAAYEPGSIFKPFTMAAALDIGAVTPETRFTDFGSVEVDDYTIKNAGEKIFGNVSMIEVLEESINTGMVWVMRQMGREQLAAYIDRFGFGEVTGVELAAEAGGNVSTLEESAEVYAATAAFGQGITTTPLQIALAYGALANGGLLMKPTVVDEIRYADGTVEAVEPYVVRRVIEQKSATTISAMLVSVVEYGHGKRAAVPGYYIAGKTGTAQIAERGVYSETAFNGSFAGFGPVNDPRFAMVVKIENPKEGNIYAEATAAPIFGEIAEFLLDYYDIPPER